MLTTEFSSLEKNIWSTRFSVKYNIDQLNNCVEMERKNFEFPKLFPNFQNFKFVLTITVIILYKPNMAEYPTTFVAEVDFSIVVVSNAGIRLTSRHGTANLAKSSVNISVDINR